MYAYKLQTTSVMIQGDLVHVVCVGVFLIGRCLYTMCLNIFFFKERSFLNKIFFKCAPLKYSFNLQRTSTKFKFSLGGSTDI
jgi:hypothetical protein